MNTYRTPRIDAIRDPEDKPWNKTMSLSGTYLCVTMVVCELVNVNSDISNKIYTHKHIYIHTYTYIYIYRRLECILSVTSSTSISRSVRYVYVYVYV